MESRETTILRANAENCTGWDATVLLERWTEYLRNEGWAGDWHRVNDMFRATHTWLHFSKRCAMIMLPLMKDFAEISGDGTEIRMRQDIFPTEVKPATVHQGSNPFFAGATNDTLFEVLFDGVFKLHPVHKSSYPAWDHLVACCHSAIQSFGNAAPTERKQLGEIMFAAQRLLFFKYDKHEPRWWWTVIDLLRKGGPITRKSSPNTLES